MGPQILIPVLLLVIIVPLVSWWAKQRFKAGNNDQVDFVAPSSRLTSNALRGLESPPWRVVYEVAPEKLSGIEHVLIGPAGAFALVTVLEALPHRSTTDHQDAREPDAQALARAAITRGGLDDALKRCALASDGLVKVHWGPAIAGAPLAIEVMHGVIAVDGRRLGQWASQLESSTSAGASVARLSASQVDLAWQTVVMSIGRPDPLN